MSIITGYGCILIASAGLVSAESDAGPVDGDQHELERGHDAGVRTQAHGAAPAPRGRRPEGQP